MLPLLGILSALSLIDRSNLGLARASGMGHDLVCFLFFASLDDQLRNAMQGFEYWVSLQHCFLHFLCSLHPFVRAYFTVSGLLP